MQKQKKNQLISIKNRIMNIRKIMTNYRTNIKKVAINISTDTKYTSEKITTKRYSHQCGKEPRTQ